MWFRVLPLVRWTTFLVSIFVFPYVQAQDHRPRGAVQNVVRPEIETRRTPASSFKLHIGANLTIPGMNNLSKVEAAPVSEPSSSKAEDPFAGLPLHALAEYLGDRIMPALEAVKEEQKKQMRDAKHMGREVDVTIPYIPPLLPVTRWASTDEHFRSTLVVDEGARQKARLSWYHPDDTMVPRDWFTRGLLEDLRYFNPFGLSSWVGDGTKKDT